MRLPGQLAFARSELHLDTYVVLCCLQDKLWQSLRGACDCLANGCLAVWHLQRVVAKKRDPLSHVLFLDELCPQGQQLLTEKYW
jgi:hypothetical protein